MKMLDYLMQTETDFKEEGSKALSDALKTNSTLTDLTMSCND